MPRTTCPACHGQVKYPKDAEPGRPVTCPACEEVFAPPTPRKTEKKYDPEEEDTYAVKGPTADAPDRDKARHTAAAVRGAARRAREIEQMSRGSRRGWFEGPEVWLLILALGVAAGLPFGLWLARSWDKLGGAKMFLIVVVLIAVMMVAAGLAGSTWAWLRKNR